MCKPYILAANDQVAVFRWVYVERGKGGGIPVAPTHGQDRN